MLSWSWLLEQVFLLIVESAWLTALFTALKVGLPKRVFSEISMVQIQYTRVQSRKFSSPKESIWLVLKVRTFGEKTNQICQKISDENFLLCNHLKLVWKLTNNQQPKLEKQQPQILRNTKTKSNASYEWN